MRNYIAESGATITLENKGKLTSYPVYSSEGLELLSNLWLKSAAEHRLMYEPTWLGRPIIQFPTDIVAIREMLWRTKPDVVIETGVAHGGSLILSASILQLIGKGTVIGIDIDIREHNRSALMEHPLFHRIKLIQGSSTEVETVNQVKSLIDEGSTVLVMLDSNHSEAHVLRELELYGPMVTPGSFMVAHDGSQAWVWDIPRGKPEWKDDHPLAAISKFLKSHPEFKVDEHYTRWQITSSPNGYLKRS